MKHSKSRVAGLSDGIFAFAATLLVVDIGTTVDLKNIHTQLPLFISFGTAFFVMMMLWKVHYNFFQRTKFVDNSIIASNTLLLFTILFYLFPLKTLINSITLKIEMTDKDLSQLFMLYGFGFVVIFMSYTFMYWRAYKRDAKNKEPLLLLYYARHFSIFSLIGVISIVLAFAQIGVRYGIPGFVYTLLGLFTFLNVKQFRKKHPTVFK